MSAMQVQMDPDVQSAAEILQARFPASKLVSITEALFRLAPILWERFEREPVTALALRHPPMPGGDRQTQSDASVLAQLCDDDDALLGEADCLLPK